MERYSYSPLLRGLSSIRLLRLNPATEEAAPIQCELVDYSMSPSQGGHLYEALSYVWGTPLHTRRIHVLQSPSAPSRRHYQYLNVTTNLYAALCKLRNAFLPRLLWVDAICINQEDLRERGLQVQMMAQIYANARCVVVWLGEETKDCRGALHEIRNSCHGPLSTEYKNTQAAKLQTVVMLLNRSWFRRIWVLQEVGVARRVEVMCGQITIDGSAFCEGLRNLDLSLTSSSYLASMVNSTTHLIRGAAFRPPITGRLEEDRLPIAPLSTLTQMFHKREAGDPRDKVYALLGMCSDATNGTLPQPDYTKPWPDLFKEILRYSLGSGIQVEIPHGRQEAIIHTMGCIIARVSSVSSAQIDLQTVTLDLCDHCGHNYCYSCQLYTRSTARLEITLMAKSLHVGDLMCLLPDCENPVFIRPHVEYFSVQHVAFDLRSAPRRWSATRLCKCSVSWADVLAAVNSYRADLLLVWNWKSSQPQHDEDKSTSFALKTYINGDADGTRPRQESSSAKLNRVIKWAQVLEDGRSYILAKEMISREMQQWGNLRLNHSIRPFPRYQLEALRIHFERKAWDWSEDSWANSRIWLELFVPNSQRAKSCLEIPVLIDENRLRDVPVSALSYSKCTGTGQPSIPSSMFTEPNALGDVIDIFSKVSKTLIGYQLRWITVSPAPVESIYPKFKRKPGFGISSRSADIKPLVSYRGGYLQAAEEMKGQYVKQKIIQRQKTPSLPADMSGIVRTAAILTAFDASRRGRLDDLEIITAAFGYWMLNEKNVYEETPLSVACQYGHAEVVRWLLNRKVDVHSTDIIGRTPLMHAVRCAPHGPCAAARHSAVIEALILKGALYNGPGDTDALSLLKARREDFPVIVDGLTAPLFDVTVPPTATRNVNAF